MHLWQLIRTASPAANFLAGACLVLLVLKILVLNAQPAPLSALHELGVLTEAVLASVVASYAFYLVVVHLPESRDRAITRPYVAKHSGRVVSVCLQQLAAVSSASGISLSLATLTQDEVESAFKKLAPGSESPMLFYPQNKAANWLEYFEYHIEKSRNNIARVFAQMKFIDARLVALLAAIDDCAHFEHLTLTGSDFPVRNADLSAWAPAFFKYATACRHLDSMLRDDAATHAA